MSKHKAYSDQYEFRSYASTLRAADGKGIQGSAVIFDALSNDLGGFVEIIERTAFDHTLMNDVVALFHHEVIDSKLRQQRQTRIDVHRVVLPPHVFDQSPVGYPTRGGIAEVVVQVD